MKHQLKINRIIILVFVITISIVASACKNDSTANIDYIDISGVQVDSNASEVDLQGKNISDISALYTLNNLKSVDLRNNPVDQKKVLTFIEANPNVEVLWSVPVFSKTYDNTTETISFMDSDIVNADDIHIFIKLFEKLKTIELYSTNISVDDFLNLKKDYPDIAFNMNVVICDNEFDSNSGNIDLSNCSGDYQSTLLNNLLYFSDINTITFGDSPISNELKDQLIGIYPDASFDWQIQLLDHHYSSMITEMDISGQEVVDLEQFKDQLKYFTSLTYIDMCDCSLSNLQMEELIEAYPQVKFVWKIQMGSWEMRTDIKAFGTCYSEYFEGGRFIGGNGFYLYAEDAAQFKYCKDLVTLDIGHQHYIHDYSFLLELDNLKHLIVALSSFEDTSLLAHMKDLEFLEIFNTNVYDLSPLAELPNLKYLNCSQTLIPNVDYLVDMKQLEVLWLCNSVNISREEAARLEQALPDCYINTTAQGSTREGWRSYDNQGYIDMRESLNMYLAFDTSEE